LRGSLLIFFFPNLFLKNVKNCYSTSPIYIFIISFCFSPTRPSEGIYDMLSSNSSFVRTEMAVGGNSIKSLLFRVAELLLVFAVWKAFSLLAAAQNRFTSYLAFSETPVQKAYFVWTRGLSQDALIVASFSVMYAISQLYGTLIWAMDAPGHVIQTQLVAASSISASLLNDPEYIVSYTITPAGLNITNASLAEVLSINLFRPGANATLTGSFDQGVPEAAGTPRQGAGPRIWLDSEGWSVTTDTLFHTVANLGASDGLETQLSCPYADIDQSRFYNCTFGNEWVPDLIQATVGTPEVHWSEVADSTFKYGNVRPIKKDVWTSLGRGSGAAIRMHMFTVTKGYRRHTFLSTIAKAAIVSTEGELPENEMTDLMWRVSSAGPEDPKVIEQGIRVILKTLTTAQRNNQSAAVGWVLGDKHQVLEGFWELLQLADFPGRITTRMFRFTSVNITLLNSETISTPPVPFESCKNSFQNVAVGGKVVDTDCTGSADLPRNGTQYFGQVDTSAVLHLDGFDQAPFATSAAALDPLLWQWVSQNNEKLTRLLLSRGYILGLDPKLVTVQLTAATPGISYLQLFMVLLAALLAVISWVSLWLCASVHWSSSFLVNLLTATGTVDFKDKHDLGVVCQIPDIRLEREYERLELRTDTGVFTHQNDHVPSAHV
jgi:hypothetical protein